MKYGLSEEQLAEIIAFIKGYPEVEEAILFGSRAIDTYKEASDIDIAIKGEKVTAGLAATIKFDLEEDTFLPFFFDVLAYPSLTNAALIEHIDNKGVRLFGGDVGGEWVDYQLSDLSIKFAMGPFGSNIKAENFTTEGVPVIRGTNLNFSRFVDGNFVFLNEAKANQLSSSNCFPGDIVITHRGTLGQFCLVPESKYERYVISQSGMKVTVNPEKLNNIFLLYFFKSDIGRNELLQHESQVGVPSISSPLTSLKSVMIRLPPLPEQKAIANVLSSLDDKIDLLHRQNKTLEAMAETLFRQWFIEEAKEDWEEKSLTQIAVFLNGLACQKYPPKNELEKLPVLKIKELSSGISENSDWVANDIKTDYIIEAGDVIFAWSASLMVKVWDGAKCALNQHLFKVSSAEYPKWFYLHWCKYHLAEFISIAVSHSTTMGHIKRADLDAAMVVVPKDNELKEMTEIIEPLFMKQIEISKQIINLEKLRDNLLPKLMSGEVRVAYDQQDAA